MFLKKLKKSTQEENVPETSTTARSVALGKLDFKTLKQKLYKKTNEMLAKHFYFNVFSLD